MVLLDTVAGSLMELTPPHSMHWSPDSAYGAGKGDSNAVLRETASGTLTPLGETDFPLFYWSSDSRYLAVLRYPSMMKTQLEILDVQTMTWYRRQVGELSYGTGIRWTPENDLLFFARAAYTEPVYQGYRWSFKTDTLVKLPFELPEFGSNFGLPGPPWSPDGTKIWYEDPQQMLHLLELDTGAEIATLTGWTYGYDNGVSQWSPDSRYLVIYTGDSFTFIDTVRRETTVLPVNTPHVYGSFVELMMDWKTSPEPTFFDANSRTVWRLIFQDGKPEFAAAAVFPGPEAHLGRLCQPEEAAP
jgi:hypothetical protein